MPIVVDKARPALRPTRGQYVDILQSETEPHIEVFITDGVVNPPLGLPTSDDRAHKTGDDAIPWGSNLITDTLVSWNVEGNIVDETGAYRFQGTTGTIASPVVASLSQGLSADPTAGQEIKVEFELDHDAGGLLDVVIHDANDVITNLGIVGGRLVDGSSIASRYILTAVIPVDMSSAKVLIRDDVGDCNALINNVVVAVRAQSL